VRGGTNPWINLLGGLSKVEWLPGWSGETTEALIALEGRYRTDSIVVAFEQALDVKASANATSLTEPEWVVLAVEALEREVNNGGFRQFFVNCEFCSPWIADALERVERKDVAEIARQAATGLATTPPDNSAAMSASALGGDPRVVTALEACDRAYLAVAGDLAPDVLAFIKREHGKIDLPKPPK
jgi:hypothetical protein